MSTVPKATRAKSRHGCLRCKSKKVKCDETKPGCRRCEERSLECPGYARNIRWSDKHEFQRQLDKNGESSRFGSNATFAVEKPTANPAIAAQIPVAKQGVSSGSLGQSLGSGLDVQYASSSSTPRLEDFLNMFETTYRQDQQNDSEYYHDFSLNNDHTTENERQYLTAFSPSNMPGFVFELDDSLTSNENLMKDLQDDVTVQQKDLGSSCADHTLAATADVGIGPSSQYMPELSLSVPNELTNTTSALCGYFFKEVITLYCAWDSRSNHMRYLLENLWQTSAPLYHTIQSMAAACLADDFPQLSKVAAKEHANALACLRDESGTTNATEDKLLSLMLLGQTASWHAPEDLATDRFRTVQAALDHWYQGSRQDATSSFFSDAMNYWAMLLAFLTDTGNLSDESGEIIIGPESLPSCSLPHPLCGTARQIVRMLADLGTLVFRLRTRMSTMKFMSEQDVQFFQSALGKARQLEQRLFDYTPTDPGMVLDPGDPRTPLLHFHQINEAYRCTGLLQIYRVFPDLLTRRYRPWNKESLLHPQPATEIPTEEQRNLWLTKLAMHILGLLREIPFESRTRSVQPFIFVAVSSELRLNPGGNVRHDEGDMSHFFIEVARARKFVSSRLSAYMHILPLRKVRVIFELVTSLWAELDAGRPNVYWVDFAFQKRLGTLMG